MVNLLPVAPDSVSALVYVGANAGPPPRHDPRAMRDYLLATCVGFPEEVRRVLGDIGPDEFVFSDAITQVELPHITQGRCALIGDAAHCPTFFSGMGSSLALQDAHILAGCLARNPGDIASALAHYEEVMTPIARRYRNSAISAHGVFLTSSRLKARLRNLVLRLLPERLFERGIRRFYDAERPLADLPPQGADESAAGDSPSCPSSLA